MIDVWSERWKKVNRDSEREYYHFRDRDRERYYRDDYVEYETESEATARVNFRLGIYDLETCRLVWLAEAHGRRKNSETRRSRLGYPIAREVRLPNSMSIIEPLLKKVVKRIP